MCVCVYVCGLQYSNKQFCVLLPAILGKKHRKRWQTPCTPPFSQPWRQNIAWFTNLDIQKRHEDLILYKQYTPDEYPKFDNYDAINVNKVSEIPLDYEGIMGVPITFFDKYNPAQFEIIEGLNRYTLLDIEGKNDWAKKNHIHFTCINGEPKYFRILIRKKK